MAKKDDGPTLLDETEKLLKKLVDEANEPATDDAAGPDFAERLKVAAAVTSFLMVKGKIAPPEKPKSQLGAMLNELHSGTPHGNSAPAAGKKSANGHVPPNIEDL